MENQKEIQTAEQLLVEIMGCLKIGEDIDDLNENDPELVPYITELINERTRRHVMDALAAAEAIGDGFEGHEAMNKAIRESYPLTNIL